MSCVREEVTLSSVVVFQKGEEGRDPIRQQKMEGTISTKSSSIYNLFIYLFIISFWINTTDAQPRITSTGRTVEGTTDYSMSCTIITVDPLRSITWERLGAVDVTIDAVEQQRTFAGLVETKATITLVITRADDEQQFRCTTVQSNNVVQTAIERLFVDVIPTPPVIQGPESISENKTGVYTCTSSGGRPASSIRWRWSNGQGLYNDNVSTVINADNTFNTISDLPLLGIAGYNGRILICEVSHYHLNEKQTATVPISVVSSVPSVTIVNETSLTFTDGQTTSITCKTGVSYPPATLTWSVGGTNINGATTTNNPDGTTTSILQYTADITDNNKILQCSATNGYGSTKSDFLALNMRYVPKVTINPTGTVNVIEGKELKLTCVVVDANPSVTSYTWSKDGAVMSGEQNPTFIRSSVQRSDDGSYTCAATNSAGTGQTSETVEVKVGEILETVSVDVSVQAVSCPTSRNQPVNITRVTDMVFVTWYKNNNDGITDAVYNPTTGGCLRPSNNEGYTIYCEKSDNNNYRFTLQVHQPTKGDVYYINSKLNDKTTIIFQDPVNIEPELKDKITLTNDRKTHLKTSITCTPLTPVFTWIIKSQNGIKTTTTGSATTNKTGCDVTKTTLTSRVTISKDTVKIINDPFTVSVQLSYKECDNIYTSQPTPYFTVKNPVPPPYMYIGIGVGGAVLLLIIIVVILCCCWKRKERMDAGSHPGPMLNLASFSREVSGTTTSGVDEPSSPSQYEV